MLTLKVTQADIDAAWEAKARPITLSYMASMYCPIAQALARTYSVPAGYVTAGQTDLVVISPTGDTRLFFCATTKAIRAYERLWDERAKAQPHTFRIRESAP